MAWKKLRTYKKPPYRRWGKNPQKVNTTQARMVGGGTVLYRDHVKSAGAPKADAVFGDDVTTRYQHLPPTLGKVALSLERYAEDKPGIPGDVSFLKGKLVRRGGLCYNEWKSVVLEPGNLYQFIMMFNGPEAYFIEMDILLGRLRKSISYNVDRARTIYKHERLKERILWEKTIRIPSG